MTGITIRARSTANGDEHGSDADQTLEDGSERHQYTSVHAGPLAASAKEPDTSTKSYHLPRLIRELRRIPFDKRLTTRLAGEG